MAIIVARLFLRLQWLRTFGARPSRLSVPTDVAYSDEYTYILSHGRAAEHGLDEESAVRRASSMEAYGVDCVTSKTAVAI